ncbi:hypothetical protein D3C77_562590 [compost metagenome]
MSEPRTMTLSSEATPAPSQWSLSTTARARTPATASGAPPWWPIRARYSASVAISVPAASLSDVLSAATAVSRRLSSSLASGSVSRRLAAPTPIRTPPDWTHDLRLATPLSPRMRS